MCKFAGNSNSLFLLGVKPLSNLEILQKRNNLLKQFVKHNSSETAQQNLVTLLLWRAYCVDVRISRKFWVIFTGSYVAFKLKNFAKIKCTTKIICNRNLNRSTELSWNFVVDKDILCTCTRANSPEMLNWFFFCENNWNFVQNILLRALCMTLVYHERQGKLRCDYTNMTIINRLCVSDYMYYRYLILILSDCPSLLHDFVIHYAALSMQCWSVGYVSLLTLSFILHDLLFVFQL